mgnify:CR=1 FL=1
MKDWQFTFQYGEIKSIVRYFFPIVFAKFTFQYGEIKSVAANLRNAFRFGFTFQYGEIKRPDYQLHQQHL